MTFRISGSTPGFQVHVGSICLGRIVRAVVVLSVTLGLGLVVLVGDADAAAHQDATTSAGSTISR